MTDKTYHSEYTVLMSTSDQRTWYPLHRYDANTKKAITCIESYTIYSGPNNPFEYVKLVILKQDMVRMAPDLKVIEPGKCILAINAVGKGTYTVTSCKYSSNKYTITAYTNADKIRRYVFSTSMSVLGTPKQMITNILQSGNYGVRFDSKHIKMEDDIESSDIISFPVNTPVWNILQICAMAIGCRIFFADGMAYVVRWKSNPGSNTGLDFDNNKSLGLLGNVSQGNVGSNGVVNCVSATYNGSDDPVTVCGVHEDDVTNGVYTYEPARQSEGFYYRRDGGEFDLSMMTLEQTKKWLTYYLDYTIEATIDVSFKLNENFSDSEGAYWKPKYDPYACIASVKCTSDEVDVNNISALNGKANPKIMLLSSVERSYPQGYSEYTFGQLKSITLSNSTSEIFASVGTKMTNVTR